VVQQHGADPARQVLAPHRARLQALHAGPQQRRRVDRQQAAHAVAHNARVRQPKAALQQRLVAAAQRLLQQHRERVRLDGALQQRGARRRGRCPVGVVDAVRAAVDRSRPLERSDALAERPLPAGRALLVAALAAWRAHERIVVCLWLPALLGAAAAAAAAGRGARQHQVPVVGGAQHLHVLEGTVGCAPRCALPRALRRRGRLLAVAGAVEQGAAHERRQVDDLLLLLLLLLLAALCRGGRGDGHALKDRLCAVAADDDERGAWERWAVGGRRGSGVSWAGHPGSALGVLAEGGN
jgi:hypothetical protein